MSRRYTFRIQPPGRPIARAMLRGTGALLVALRAATAQQPAPALAFTGTTVVDVEAGRLLPDQTVTIVGSRIQAIGPAARVVVPQGARVVDARGKYLIPGLWDMHAHVRNLQAVYYPLFVATGVTGIREMDQPFWFDSTLQWRTEMLAGTRVGPRIVATANMIEGSDDAQAAGEPWVFMVSAPEEGARAVDSLKALGADFVKVHSEGLSREAYFAIAAEARKLRIPLVGHLPTAVTLQEASDSGQRSIEHINEFPSPCASPNTGYIRALEPASDKACAELAARFIRNGTWFTPTLAVFDGWLSNTTQADRSARYWPMPGTATMLADHQDTREWILEDGKRLVGSAHRAGIPLLAGTDGFAPVHRELALLVESGLTPVEALRTATLNPAKFFGAADSLGTVTTGKLADLVLLDGDPLADIHNVAKVSAVTVNGHYYDRAALEGLLAGLTPR